eukprot:3319268-Pyramimonas_sp.AAC.1
MAAGVSAVLWSCITSIALSMRVLPVGAQSLPRFWIAFLILRSRCRCWKGVSAADSSCSRASVRWLLVLLEDAAKRARLDQRNVAR